MCTSKLWKCKYDNDEFNFTMFCRNSSKLFVEEILYFLLFGFNAIFKFTATTDSMKSLYNSLSCFKNEGNNINGEKYN